jgi:hypothetical protein
MDKQELIQSETSVDIANFSFNVGKMEEVGLSKVWSKLPYTKLPDSYSVTWSEWIKDEEGKKIVAETEPQVQKVKNIQKFVDFNKAKDKFLQKVTDYLLLYKEEIKETK